MHREQRRTERDFAKGGEVQRKGNIGTGTMKIKPLRDQVLLELLKEERKKGGIILPDTIQKERPEKAKVVAVGPGKVVDGKLAPMSLKKGDVVLFTKYGPNEIKVDEKEYLIAREEDILAVLE